MSTFGKAYGLLEKLQNVQQEINQAAPSSPSHSLLLEMGLIQHGSPSELERYYQAAPQAYMQDPLASELRGQFLATNNRADLYPVFKAFDGPLYNEQVCLIPWGPSELRKQALLEIPESSSLMGYGLDKQGLSRVTMALAWGDLPTAQALMETPAFPGETPATPPQAMLVGAMVALLRLSGGALSLSPQEHEKHLWQALGVLEKALDNGADLAVPCPELMPMLEFMSDSDEVGLRDSPVGRLRGFDPSYVHPPTGHYESRPQRLTPAYIARRTVRNSLGEHAAMPADVFEALVKQIGRSTLGRKVLTEVACDRFTTRFGKAMDGIELLLEDETDPVWKPDRWTLDQTWVPNLPLSEMMLHKKQWRRVATNEEVEKWVDHLVTQCRSMATGPLPRKQEVFEKMEVLEKHLDVWISPEQKEFLKWGFRSLREAVEEGAGNGTDQEMKAFLLKLTGVKEFAWTQVRAGEVSTEPQRRKGPRL